ncbi:MAG: DUF1643 domain-containing protein [Actinomycetota bacterium]
MIRAATFDPERIYRYRLSRVWNDSLPAATWIMLNPSTAGEQKDDRTISRVIDFSRRWGYGSALVTNLFAYRTPSPAFLRRAQDPVGPLNDESVAVAVRQASTVMAAWGNHGSLANPATGVSRSDEMLQLLDEFGIEIEMLRLTAQGQPAHPLYLPSHIRPKSICHQYTAKQRPGRI